MNSKRTSQSFIVLGCMLAIAVVSMSTQSAAAATINVTSNQDNVTAGDGNCTLREAINNANANADTTAGDCAADATLFDQINLPPGTIRMQITGAGEDANATGDFDVLEFASILGDPNNPTTIQANGDRIFDIQHAGVISTTLLGLILTGGEVTTDGGAVQITANARVNVTQVTVTENSADGHGGGIACDGCNVVNIRKSIFTKNTADADTSGEGDGGAMSFNDGGFILIEDSQVGPFSAEDSDDGNTAEDGGGVSISGTSGGVDINRSTFAFNEASDDGGGLSDQKTSLRTRIENSTFSGNSSAGSGGGIDLFNNPAANPSMTLRNVTVTNNASAVGGGVSFSGVTFIEMGNTLIAGNIDTVLGNDNPDCFNVGTLTSQGNNLIGKNNGCDTEFPEGNPNASDDFVGTLNDPVPGGLNPLALNPSGMTSTHSLQPESVAVDNGDNTICSGGLVNNEDQRTMERPKRFGDETNCDIGAFELQIYEPLASPEAIRVSLGFHAQFHCGEQRILLTNSGDDIESIDLFETEISVVYPQDRISSRPISARDQVQIVQSLTLTDPANFFTAGAMTPFAKATLNPGKTFRLTCKELRRFPLTFDGELDILTTIGDELSGSDDFFQGEFFIQSTETLIVEVKKIQTSWIGVPKSGGGTEFKNGTTTTQIFEVSSSRSSGSKLVEFEIPAQPLPVASASISNIDSKPEIQIPTFKHSHSRKGNSVLFSSQGTGARSTKIEVFGLNGQRVYSDEQAGNQLRWNLRNNHGRPVSNGVYLYIVHVRGPDGMSIRSEVRKLVILR